MRHAIHWFEIPVTDMARAVRFYEDTLQRPLHAESTGPDGPQMAVFDAAGDDAVKGCLFHHAAQSALKPSPHGTLVYLDASPSLEACLARAQAAGGAVVTPIVVPPDGMGRFAHIRDSEGNRVGLHVDA